MIAKKRARRGTFVNFPGGGLAREPWDSIKTEKQFLLNFNDLLIAKANVLLLSETVMAELIDDLDGNVSIRDEGYWLTLARIHELTLLCAENYANNCEFSLVGDLLLNPRLVLIHVPGSNQTIAKNRHRPLSVQFREVGSNAQEVRNWLKQETLVEVKTEALLPDLIQRLEDCGCFDPEYLDSVEQRKRRIADLLGFLASGGVTDNVSLIVWLKDAGPADRELLESKFCPLHFEAFFELDRRFWEWMQTGNTPGANQPNSPRGGYPWRRQRRFPEFAGLSPVVF